MCLEEGSYSPYACGGSDDSEVSWSVGGVSGSADDSCTSTFGSVQAGPELPSVPVKSQSECTPADEGMAQILNDYNASACILLIYMFVKLQMGTWTSNSWTKAIRECSRPPTLAQAAHRGVRLALWSARAAPAKSSSSFRYHQYAQYIEWMHLANVLNFVSMSIRVFMCVFFNTLFLHIILFVHRVEAHAGTTKPVRELATWKLTQPFLALTVLNGLPLRRLTLEAA